MSLEIPNTLAFARSIEPSIFSMWGSSSTDSKGTLEPVEIVIETKRGTIANSLKADALSKFANGGDDKKSPANANPQSVEAAYLPANCDTLVLKGQIAFIPNASNPTICNGLKFAEAITAFHTEFSKTDGWLALAERYVMNLVNARFAWRNKVAASKVVTTLVDSAGNSCEFDSMSISGNGLSASATPSAKAFIESAAKALGAKKGSSAYVISVACKLLLGDGAVVYPSQEFSSSKDKDDRGQEVGKILAKRKLRDGLFQGILHEQKVGNAVRQIDTWYHPTIGPLQPLAAEPYAPLTTMGTFFRQGLKTKEGNKVEHFYDILGDLSELTKQVASSSKATDRALYFSAVLVRGGVFGAKSE
jgi:CRISPR-associated protein Csy3